MDKEYRLSALRVQRNVLEAEMAEDELRESERYERIRRQIDELCDGPSESAPVP